MTELTGTGTLVRFIVARDRVRIATWTGAIAALVLLTAASVRDLYPTQADLDEAAAAAGDNAAAIALNGPAQGLDTLGGQVAFQVGAFGLVVTGLMCLLMVGRLTRAEEEAGRRELVRSMAVGRHAPATAALLVVAAAAVLLGALVAVGLIAMDLPATGSAVLGASFAAFGIVMAAVAAVAAEVTENPRVSSGLCGTALGAAFVVRAAGDVGDGTLSWFSPIGLAQKARPYVVDRWWPLLVELAVAAGLVALATAIAARRDLGTGLVRPRRGSPVAARGLGGPLGLAVRLQRGSLAAWSGGLLLTGAAYGWVANDVEDLVGDNDTVREVIARGGGTTLTDSYLATTVLVLALVGGGYAASSAVRLRGEETALRAEPVLAAPVSRRRWALSHLAVALVGCTVVLAAGGLGIGLAYGIAAGDLGQVPRLTGAAVAYSPACWLLVAVAAALFGALPRAQAAVWAALSACFVIGVLGDLLDLPGWLTAVSPFQHVPRAPVADLDVVPLAVLSGIAAALTATGLATLTRRDLT